MSATDFQLSYQVSPIIFADGIASDILGGLLPIISLSQAINFAGLLGGGDLDDLNAYILQFQPMPGSTLIEQKIGMYPFANQQVAANATIREPIAISMIMNVNPKPGMGYATKSAMLAGLQASFESHNSSGGTYTVATPALIYTELVMLKMTDISRGDLKMAQNAYQLDFIKPLISLAAAAAASMNASMGGIADGSDTSGATSGAGNTVGDPSTGATPSVVPAGSNTVGTGGGSGYGPGTSLSSGGDNSIFGSSSGASYP